MWWVTDYLNPPKPTKKPKEPAPRQRHPREFTMADLPPQCRDVLASR
jgi:penicillin-insensitive murein endopeptidase